MKVIILAGLVSAEKIELTRELAQYFADKNSVAVIDNIARMPVDKIEKSIPVRRIEDNAIPELVNILQETVADFAIVALSEQAHPEKLFIALDDLREQQSDWEIYSLALIDTRTCDCFPNVREALEMYADVSVMIPYQLEEIVRYVNSA